jgi:anti-sigma regulatory factor (Ser/Thr protein kinase)
MAVQRAGPDPDRDSSPASDGPIPASATFDVPATASSVGPVRRAVADFARGHGASVDALGSVNLAVSEAVTNVVVHAYRDARAPGPVLVGVAVRDGRLTVTVADEGCGMTPRSDSPGLGLGMGLIARMADTFEVTERSARAGLVLRMGFALAG